MKKLIYAVALCTAVATLTDAQDALTINPQGNIVVYVHGEPRLLEIVLPPVGAIEAYAFSTEPAGWLICDGRAIDKSTDPKYAVLVDALRAEAAGNPNHPYYHADPNKAHIPDLRGRFARGLDAGTGRDPGAAAVPVANEHDRRLSREETTEVGAVLGSVQGDSFQGHWHYERGVMRGTHADGEGGYSRAQRQSPDDQPGRRTLHPVNDGFNGTPRTSAETRPENVAVNYIIKY